MHKVNYWFLILVIVEIILYVNEEGGGVGKKKGWGVEPLFADVSMEIEVWLYTGNPNVMDAGLTLSLTGLLSESNIPEHIVRMAWIM